MQQFESLDTVDSPFFIYKFQKINFLVVIRTKKTPDDLILILNISKFILNSYESWKLVIP